jgi:hypothetical protein
VAALPIIPYTEQTAYGHTRVWADLQSEGKVIGAYDLIAAATALERGSHLATFNKRHFAMVKGLYVVAEEFRPQPDLKSFLSNEKKVKRLRTLPRGERRWQSCQATVAVSVQCSRRGQIDSNYAAAKVALGEIRTFSSMK